MQILMKDNEQKTIHSLRFTGKQEQNKNKKDLNQYKKNYRRLENTNVL